VSKKKPDEIDVGAVMNRIQLVVFGILAITAAAGAQTIQVSKDNRTIAITTTDEAEAIADRAVVSIGFTTYGIDQDQTYSDASKTSNAIIRALKDSGVNAEAIQSVSQSLSQIDDNDKVRYAKGIRFVFSQSWTVTVAAKDAADTLHLAVMEGANNSGNIFWQLADERPVEAQAAEKALVHAREIAEQMAKGMRAVLGPLVYASNEAPPNRQGIGYGSGGGLGGGRFEHKNLKPLAISPEKITKSATVYAVFSLE